jgi:hypothetical protein
MIPRNLFIARNDWLTRYEAYFDVPNWLAEEKFEFCDNNHDQEIHQNELLCF